MSTPVAIGVIVTEPEREGRNRVASLLESVHRLAFDVRDARHWKDRAHERLVMLGRLHEDFVSANTRKVTAWWGAIAALVGIWGLDVMLSMPTSQYYVTRFAAFGPTATWIACILIPTGIFLAEFFVIAGQRLVARDAAIDAMPLSYYGWTAAGLLLAIVVTGLIASTQLAAAGTGGFWALAVAQKIRLMAMTGTAFVLHAIVVLSGKVLHDAVGYGYLVKRLERAERQLMAERSPPIRDSPEAVFHFYIWIRA